MNHTKITTTIAAVAAMLITSLFSTLAAASAVESISLEVFQDTKQPYWQVAVVCAGKQDTRTMHKPVADKQWCSSTNKKLCNENKFTLSEAICGDNSATQIASASGAESTDISNKAVSKPKKVAQIATNIVANNALVAEGVDRQALLREQMRVEEQQIQIQQKRLELRRRELNLKRRQIEG